METRKFNNNYKKNNYASDGNTERKPYNNSSYKNNDNRKSYSSNGRKEYNESPYKKNSYSQNNENRSYNKPYSGESNNSERNNRYNNNNSERNNRYNNNNSERNNGYSNNNRYNNSENRYNNSENRYNSGENRYNNGENRYNNGDKYAKNDYRGGNNNRYNNNNENKYGSNNNRYNNGNKFNKKPFANTYKNNSEPVEYAPVPATETRLNKFIADAGICSRRNADVYISAGNVTVNGVVMTTLGYRVKPTDEVRFDGKLLSSEKKEYILLNKPKGFITTTNDEKGRKTVMDLVANATNVRILPVGRLDRATTGLLLLTNDGELTKKLTHPTHGVRKIYHVILDRKLEYKDFVAIQEGLELEDGFIEVDEISYVNDKPKNEIGIKIHSGRNRIVRRIFEHLGYQVDKLDRVVFAGLTKKDLPRGHWRRLTQQEVINLRNMK